MSKFNITDHVDFDKSGRAQCPACLNDGKTGRNLSLVPGSDGAYKCFRGCTPQEIREAIGSPKATTSAPPQSNSITKLQTHAQLKRGRDSLQSSKHALLWLLDRGFSRDQIEHFGLVAVRASTPRGGHLPAIGIPIEIEPGRFALKKRIAPWLNEEQRDDAPAWGQYGIGCRTFFAHNPPTATETWLCEGEWDAMMLGWAVMHSDLDAKVCVACFTGGAGNLPPGQEIDALPAGKITTFYDLDKSGEEGAIKVAKRVGDRVKLGRVPRVGEVAPGYDVSNALKAGFGLIDFAAASAAAESLPAPKPEKPPNALRDRLITNDELLARAEDYTDWLVPDILTPNELFLMAAPPRTGKSLFCLTLAKAVATGGKFLDRPCTQGGVLYVNLEDSESKVKIRQISQGWGAGMPVYWLDKFKLDELGDLQAIAKEIPNLRLIILDTFSRIRSDSGKECGSEIGRVLEPLQEMAKEMGLTILLTHHTSKLNAETAMGPGVSPFDLIRGNSSLRGAARGAIVILPGEDCYRICCENGYSEASDLRARLNPANLEWQLLGRWNPRIEGTLREKVLDYLNLNGQGTVRQIASDLGYQASIVGNCLSKLHGEEMLTKVGGSGRNPAIYVRSFTLLHLGESPCEAYNPYTTSDTALLHNQKVSETSPEKVITGEKSDQYVDHFSENTSNTPQVVKQSCEEEPTSVPCFTRKPHQVKQSEAKEQPQLSEFKKGRVVIDTLDKKTWLVCGVDSFGYVIVAEEVGGQGIPFKPDELIFIPSRPGGKVRYCGDNWQRQRFCGSKHLTIESIQIASDGQPWATISHPSLAIPQSFPCSELRGVG